MFSKAVSALTPTTAAEKQPKVHNGHVCRMTSGCKQHQQALKIPLARKEKSTSTQDCMKRPLRMEGDKQKQDIKNQPNVLIGN